jgi:hypothetical protein
VSVNLASELPRFTFEPQSCHTTHPSSQSLLPLAPVSEAQKDARRVDLTKSSGALQLDYNRSALNLIAQVAAQRLGCPIGVCP